jgi:hypothetical protein
VKILKLIAVSWFSSDMDIVLNGEIFAHLRFGGKGKAGSILVGAVITTSLKRIGMEVHSDCNVGTSSYASLKTTILECRN